MSNHSLVPPQLHLPSPSQHMNDTYYDQYSTTDGLYRTHVHRQRAFDSFSTYQLRPDLPSLDTNVHSPVPESQPSSSLSHTIVPNTPHNPRISINYQHQHQHQHQHQKQQHQQEPYVATLRKQKATVWCEHSQAEDPRIMASLRTAKARAILEVTGSAPSMQDQGLSGSDANSPASSLHGGIAGHGGSSGPTKPHKVLASTGVAGGVQTVRKKTWVKDRSASGHGGSKRIVMEPGSLIVGAVPVRLSATEVTGDSGEEDVDSIHRGHSTPKTSYTTRHHHHHHHHPHHQTRDGEYLRQSMEGLHHSNSTGSKSSAASSAYSVPRSVTTETEQVPSVTILESHVLSGNPFPLQASGRASLSLRERKHSSTSSMTAPNTTRRAPSCASSSNSSSSSVVEKLGPLPTGLRGKKVRAPTSELQRHGSVDEREARTRTMSGVRLFVANPDAH